MSDLKTRENDASDVVDLRVLRELVALSWQQMMEKYGE